MTEAVNTGTITLEIINGQLCDAFGNSASHFQTRNSTYLLAASGQAAQELSRNNPGSVVVVPGALQGVAMAEGGSGEGVSLLAAPYKNGAPVMKDGNPATIFTSPLKVVFMVAGGGTLKVDGAVTGLACHQIKALCHKM
jgi:hypothetical protein